MLITLLIYLQIIIIILFIVSDFNILPFRLASKIRLLLTLLYFLCVFLEFKQNLIRVQVALGYRDKITGPWQRLASGNITRTLECRPNNLVSM